MDILDKVRRWIDGETSERVLEDAARDAQVKPRSQAEEFIVKIARGVEEVMQRELVPLPQGTAIIPSEYTIFLSDADDKEWKGAKRRGLEQGLYHILAERALELAGRKKLETEAFVVQFKVDGTLERDQIRVQHSWEDSSGPKTQILKRPLVPGEEPPVPTPQPPLNPETPFPDGSAGAAGPSVPSPQPGDAEEMTRVGARATELYRLEVWRAGALQSIVPVLKSDAVIGRGSRSKPVDVVLDGDLEISRRQVVISLDGFGSFWVLNEGRNPVMVNNAEVFTGQRVKTAPGIVIGISSYLLRIVRP